jgi:hypothetical protein
VAGSEGWFVVDMVPGTDPVAEFQTALLRVAARPLPQTWPTSCTVTAWRSSRAALWVVPGDGGELVLVVDQFEELFTLVEDDEERAAFLASVMAAATEPDNRLRVVITLRADFYDRPLATGGLAELVRGATEAVVPLTPGELERAISGPAEQVGVTVDSALVAKMVADVTEQPGALPLLQYALTELFDRRQDATLTPGRPWRSGTGATQRKRRAGPGNASWSAALTAGCVRWWRCSPAPRSSPRA